MPYKRRRNMFLFHSCWWSCTRSFLNPCLKILYHVCAPPQLDINNGGPVNLHPPPTQSISLTGQCSAFNHFPVLSCVLFTVFSGWSPEECYTQPDATSGSPSQGRDQDMTCGLGHQRAWILLAPCSAAKAWSQISSRILHWRPTTLENPPLG